VNIRLTGHKRATINGETTESTETLQNAFPTALTTINESFWKAGLKTSSKHHCSKFQQTPLTCCQQRTAPHKRLTYNNNKIQ